MSGFAARAEREQIAREFEVCHAQRKDIVQKRLLLDEKGIGIDAFETDVQRLRELTGPEDSDYQLGCRQIEKERADIERQRALLDELERLCDETEQALLKLSAVLRARDLGGAGKLARI